MAEGGSPHPIYPGKLVSMKVSLVEIGIQEDRAEFTWEHQYKLQVHNLDVWIMISKLDVEIWESLVIWGYHL